MIQTSEPRFNVFTINFEHAKRIILVFLIIDMKLALASWAHGGLREKVAFIFLF